MRAARGAMVLGACLALLPACRRAPPPPPAQGQEPPSLHFNGFSARASHEGRRVWEAQAVSALVYREGQRAEAQDVTITYFNRGRRVSTARADRALMDLKNYDVDASGHVHVQGTNGVILDTLRLHWDNRHQRASSDDAVRIQRGGTVLTGVGFSADRDLHDVKLLSQVQAEAASVLQLRQDARTWKAQP